MTEPLLIAPDNRLLGWALSDLTLYGAQPTPEVTIGRALADGEALDAPSALSVEEQSAPAAREGDLAQAETTALLADPATQPATTSVPAPTSFIQIPIAAPAGDTVQPSVPQPTGAGSFVQAPIATPLQSAQSDSAPVAVSSANADLASPEAVTSVAGSVT